MRLFEETDKRFIGIEKKIGLFIVVALLGLLSVGVFIGIRQDIFTPKGHIYFISKSGQGIAPGMPVKLSGFIIGKVSSSLLKDVGKVQVELSINKKYMRWIKSDSTARLIKEGLIGEGVIEIVPGKEDSQEIEEGAVIKFEREPALGEMADELKQEIKPMLSDLREIIYYANNDKRGNLKITLSNLSRLSDELLRTRKNLDGLIGSVGTDVNHAVKRIDETLASVQEAVGDLKSVINQTGGNIEDTFRKLDMSLENLQKASAELKALMEGSAPKIPELIENGSVAVEGAKEVVDSVKGIWPVSKGIEKPKEKTIKVDSFGN